MCSSDLRSAAPELPAARAHLRYVLVLDDATQSLASVALDLSRLGILPLYTPFPDESKLLAAQERGRIGALMVSPEVSPGDVQSLVRYVDTLQESASPALIVVGEEPGEDRREELRRLGASWALWKPYADGQLRFVLNAAMESPSSQTARSEPRAPTELRVSVAGAGGSSVASILTVSAGGAFIEMDAPPALGTRLRICFEIDGEPLDVSARVVYSNLRRSEEHTSELSHMSESRMPSSA